MPSRLRSLRIGLVVAFAVLVAATSVYAGVRFGVLDPQLADPSGETRIDSCTTIDRPGRYVLTTTIEEPDAATCIRIRSSDVVFDGSGHAIQGTGAFGTAGVTVGAFGTDVRRTNVTVRNVTATGWDDAIRFTNVVNGTIARTTAADSRIGISLYRSETITVANNTVRENAVYGIGLFETSANNTVANNTVVLNGLYGIDLVGPGATDNRLVDNAVTRNDIGVVVVEAEDAVLADNAVAPNRAGGIRLIGVESVRLENNTGPIDGASVGESTSLRASLHAGLAPGRSTSGPCCQSNRDRR